MEAVLCYFASLSLSLFPPLLPFLLVKGVDASFSLHKLYMWISTLLESFLKTFGIALLMHSNHLSIAN